MASRVSAEALLGEERSERELEALRSQVQREKEIVRVHFQQLHLLLAAREASVLLELDEIVERVRGELREKRALLQQLDRAREDGIGEVLGGEGGGGGEGVRVGWVEVVWNEKGVEEAVSDVCKVVRLKEKPVQAVVEYSLKVRPVWSRVTGGKGPDQIACPTQIAIDNTTHNIFVTDLFCHKIQVFDSEGSHLYSITDHITTPVGIALTNEFIFVSIQGNLLKLNKSTNELVKSVKTESMIWGVEIDEQTNIYVCENDNKSVIVFGKNLKFLRRIKLKSSHLESDTQTHSIKLYQNTMYVMFGECPTYHLQIFSLEGELIRCLIPKEEIGWSYFFCLDPVGNIIVADWGDRQIKIFSNEGNTIHTICNANLAENEKFDDPYGVALDKFNRIIVAQQNPQCCLQAF